MTQSIGGGGGGGPILEDSGETTVQPDSSEVFEVDVPNDGDYALGVTLANPNTWDGSSLGQRRDAIGGQVSTYAAVVSFAYINEATLSGTTYTDTWVMKITQGPNNNEIVVSWRVYAL